MRTLYDNYNTNYEGSFEYYKEYCEVNEIEMPTDAENSNDFYEWVADQQQMAWDDLMFLLECDECDVTCVVTGSLGLWNGRRGIEPKAFSSLKSAIYACVNGSDYAIITEDDGEILVKAIHHDGDNNFIIRKLNKEGHEAYCNDEEFAKEEYYEKFDIKF